MRRNSFDDSLPYNMGGHSCEFLSWVRHSREQLTELDVIVNDKHAVHGGFTALPDAIPSPEPRPTFTKLYPA
jgi:hypothetical protein